MVCTDQNQCPDGAVVRLADATRPECAGAKAAALARAHQAGLPGPSRLRADARRGRHDRGGHPSTLTAARRASGPSSPTTAAARSSCVPRPPSKTASTRRWPAASNPCSTCAAGTDSSTPCAPSSRVAKPCTKVCRSRAAWPCSSSRSSFPTPAASCSAPTPSRAGTDRFVIAAVPGGPDQLVSGEVDGVTLTLTARGKVVESTGSISAVDTTCAGSSRCRSAPPSVFGGPQDVEWAIVDDDVVMLQSRPITATGTDTEATGPIFGPGPVAETFPERARAARARPLGRADDARRSVKC